MIGRCRQTPDPLRCNTLPSSVTQRSTVVPMNFDTVAINSHSTGSTRTEVGSIVSLAALLSFQHGNDQNDNKREQLQQPQDAKLPSAAVDRMSAKIPPERSNPSGRRLRWRCDTRLIEATVEWGYIANGSLC